ncbi:AAA domain-containing protein, putative AbiEii toxin, Type IV TA system [Terribacillus saccharophilus]|uniref:AAA domain-containing protein, putative AbiEii toxin, Type IV TA system n=1 Tax=Terribacillus saccharophilus TaxID=361277 RepID=A0AAX2EJN7_9BACI|nr:AAA domain-containing protein, putative AbiEii toxin, Type IV TA system [Terribacillus saccharophilus]
MDYYIKEQDLSSKSFIVREYGRETLENLSKVNILVGSNNSGKSRFLRNLASMNEISFRPSEYDYREIQKLISSFKFELASIINKYNANAFGAYTIQSLRQTYDPWIHEGEDPFTEYNQMMKSLENMESRHDNISWLDYSNPTKEEDAANMYKEVMDLLWSFRDENHSFLPDDDVNLKIKFKRTYIPTLRGLRGYSSEDLYEIRTKDDYFKDVNIDGFSIHTGLNLYEEVTDLLLGSVSDRRKIADFQKFLGDSFFDKKPVTLTPDRELKVLKVQIGNETEKKIYELGDGIQSLIILTFPLFKHKGENLLLFIEEPELYLHPGMQRKFIEIVLQDEQFRGHQVFITTHSNHFLDMTLDMERISVYKFRKYFAEQEDFEQPLEEIDAQFEVTNVSNEDSSVLQELGVKNSAVLLSNCTIWVEGITDRFYIRRFLKVFQEFHPDLDFKEDVHYSFVEYSGANITHWSFLDKDGTDADEDHTSMNAEKVCSTLFLISDKDGEDKRGRQEQLKEVLEERYYCLECLEIENILTVDTLKNVIAEYEKTTSLEQPLEHLKKDEFTQEEYKNEKLGDFINSLFYDEEPRKRKRKGSYAAESGTIANKLDFCKRAIKHINTYDDLSEEARLLCENLYGFIKANNL